MSYYIVIKFTLHGYRLLSVYNTLEDAKSNTLKIVREEQSESSKYDIYGCGIDEAPELVITLKWYQDFAKVAETTYINKEN